MWLYAATLCSQPSVPTLAAAPPSDLKKIYIYLKLTGSSIGEKYLHTFNNNYYIFIFHRIL